LREIATVRYSTYELKYCERCGGLGLRRDKSGPPYCRDCEQMLEHLLIRKASAPSVPGALRRIARPPLAALSSAPLNVYVPEASYVG